MEYTVNEISVEICSRLGIKINGKTDGQVVVHCVNPYHIDKRPSCSISLDKGLYHCFSCGSGGSLKNLYYEKTGRSIYRDLGVQRSYSFQPEVEKADLSLVPEVDFRFKGHFIDMNMTELGKNWMKRRGFNIQLLNKLNVRYVKYGRTYKESDPSNKEEWRIYSDMAIIPIYEGGNLLCFEARQLRTEDEWRKHLKSKKITAKEYRKVLYPKNSSTKTLFQYEYLDFNKKLYVVEGLMDLISLRTNDMFENSTTTFGRSIKERQFYLLNKFKEICIIPNNDGPGISALEQFKNKKNVSVLLLPKTVKDVNDVLMKKDPRYNSLQDLLDKNWITEKEIPLEDFNLETYIQSLS